MDKPCLGTCPNHDWICERGADHEGGCGCSADPEVRDELLAKQRKQQIADRVEAHRVYQDLIETTPDVD